MFLRYLYYAQVDKLVEMYLDLFAAGDKYDVQPLREIYIKHMCLAITVVWPLPAITVDNAVDVLALAERHSVEPSNNGLSQ